MRINLSGQPISVVDEKYQKEVDELIQNDADTIMNPHPDCQIERTNRKHYCTTELL